MEPLSPLAIAQIERRVKKIRQASEFMKVKFGWINFMRQALCMRLSDLGKLTEQTKAAVQHFEKREIQGKVTLETLQNLASVMDCDLVYAFVPKKAINEILWDRAFKKARRLVRNADVHMELEDQKVKEFIEERVTRIAKDLLAKGDIW